MLNLLLLSLALLLPIAGQAEDDIDYHIPAASADDLLGMATLNCSGALVRLKRRPTDRAVLLTNGHCVRDPMPQGAEVLLNTIYNRGGMAVFAKPHARLVNPTRVLYGTMKDTDLGLIEFEQTYAELEAGGAKVYSLTETDPAPGLPIRIISGYWMEKQECTLDYQVPHLREGTWDFTRGYALDSSCHIRGGYSGAPVIDIATDKIVAVANTGPEGGEPCANMNPCEILPNHSVKVRKGIGYVQRVSDVLPCVTDAGEIDLSLPACKLARPPQR